MKIDLEMDIEIYMDVDMNIDMDTDIMGIQRFRCRMSDSM